LEIGCASGPNLWLLARKYPKAIFFGIDISKKAIKTGRNFFKNENIGNVFLSSGRAAKLKGFKDKSIDIIFTDAVMIYQGADKINQVISEMVRVAKKVIILREWQGNIPNSFRQGHWVHNYRFLFSNFVPVKKIKISRIPENLMEEGWGKLDYIIEVIL